jgi:hypothetical protein
VETKQLLARGRPPERALTVGEQQAIHAKAEGALHEGGIEYRLSSSGAVVGGGTPEHRWVEVTIDGHPQNLKILAANDREADEELDRMARDMGLERERLNIVPPKGWAGYGLAEPDPE